MWWMRKIFKIRMKETTLSATPLQRAGFSRSIGTSPDLILIKKSLEKVRKIFM
jgi:hypothetical protein